MTEEAIANPPDIDEDDDFSDSDSEPGAGVAANGSASLLDRLKQIREDLGAERVIVLEVPGYDGLLFVKYQYVDGMWDAMKKIGNTVEKSKDPRKELKGQADTLLFACKEVVVYQPDREDADAEGYAPINPELDGPTKFDEHLAEALGFEAETARGVLFGTFRNALAVSKQHSDLMEWAASSQKSLDEDTSGK